MSLFARLLQALYDSRQREAERVIRRYAHLGTQARVYEARRAVEIAEANATAAAHEPLLRLTQKTAS